MDGQELNRGRAVRKPLRRRLWVAPRNMAAPTLDQRARRLRGARWVWMEWEFGMKHLTKAFRRLGFLDSLYAWSPGSRASPMNGNLWGRKRLRIGRLATRFLRPLLERSDWRYVEP